MNIFQKIKAFFVVKDSVQKIEEAYKMDTTKPGWKTTEFWGKLAIQVFTILGAVKGFVKPELATVIISALEGIYGIARSVVKYKGGTLPDLPQV